MEPTANQKFSVGILGCARVAKKNCRAIKASSCCAVAAIASRSKEKADGFINEVLVDDQESFTTYSGEDAYNTLLDSTNLDSVYIPLPTKLHEQYVAKALSSKHVLLEKPVATSAASYRQMLDAASKSGKFLMDGTMFVHHPRTAHFVTSIPNPNRVHFNFTFDASGGGNFFKNDIRVKKDGDCMGCVGDLGWYCVRMGLLVFSACDASVLKGMAIDARVVRYQLNEEGVPIGVECIVTFEEVRLYQFVNTEVHTTAHS